MKYSKNTVLWLFLVLSITINAQNRSLKVEPNHSTIGFAIPIAGFTKVTGKFTEYDISIDWNDEDLSKSKFSSAIKVASINTGIPDRDAHLRSPDFFNEDNYPIISFESDSIKKVDYSHFKVFGSFKMHGVTKHIVLPFQLVKQDGNTIGFQIKTVINRLDYGVGSAFKHTAMPDFLAEEIEVEIYFWTKKQ